MIIKLIRRFGDKLTASVLTRYVIS